MRLLIRLFALVLLMFLPVPLAAQTASDVSGHWDGAINADGTAIPFQIDLLTRGGVLAGTFSGGPQGVKGLPLGKPAVEGRTLRFSVSGSPFEATLSADGTTMSGVVTFQGASYPFELARKGAARIAPEPKSAPISRSLEGTWEGAADAGGQKSRFILKMANAPDGTSGGTLMNLDGSNIELPVLLVQSGSKLTVTVPAVDASYLATLNAAGTELTGTLTVGGRDLPLAFTRRKR
jgi:hypothetical protein